MKEDIQVNRLIYRFGKGACADGVCVPPSAELARKVDRTVSENYEKAIRRHVLIPRDLLAP